VKSEIQKPQFYGRRKGYKLRRGRQNLIDTLLPEISIPLLSRETILDPTTLFEQPVKSVWMEVGFGAGEHLLHQAKMHPDIGFLGIEPYINGVGALLSSINHEELPNIRIFNDDVRLLLNHLTENSLGRVFLLFSDPWPKKRHQRRRLLSHELLDHLNLQMQTGSELRFASDDLNYVRNVLRVIFNRTDFVWAPEGPDDWRRRPQDSVETRYAAKARQAGRPIIYLNFEKV